MSAKPLFSSDEMLDRLEQRRAEMGPDAARASLNFAAVICGATSYGLCGAGGGDFVLHPIITAMTHTRSTTRREIALLQHCVGRGDWTVEKLARATFSARTCAGVDAITIRPDEGYPGFMERCGANPDARAVKIVAMTPGLVPFAEGFRRDDLHTLGYHYLLGIQNEQLVPGASFDAYAKTANPTHLSPAALQALLEKNAARSPSGPAARTFATTAAPLPASKKLRHGKVQPLFTREEIIERVLSMPEPMSRESLALFIMGCVSFGTRVRSGEDYALHPLTVSMSEKDDPAKRIIGLLHDVVEDSDWTLDDLRRVGFTGREVAGVGAMTRRECEAYYDFIERCSRNRDAIDLKIADITHNMDESRPRGFITEEDLQRDRKYKIALQYLIAIKQGEIAPGSSIVDFTRARPDEFVPSIAKGLLRKHSSRRKEVNAFHTGLTATFAEMIDSVAKKLMARTSAKNQP